MKVGTARAGIAKDAEERLERETASERVGDDIDRDESGRRVCRGFVEQRGEAIANVARTRDASHVRERLRESPIGVARPVHRHDAIVGDGRVARDGEDVLPLADETPIRLEPMLFVHVEAVDEEDHARAELQRLRRADARLGDRAADGVAAKRDVREVDRHRG